jgi:hypothetical protein
MTLTQEDAHRLFEYKDGELFWKVRDVSDFANSHDANQWNSKHAGTRAGCYGKKPYVYTAIKHKNVAIHRIIFLMQHGYLPKMIDHIDCNPRNNKIENLRAATSAENQRNQKLPRHNTSGFKGVVWSIACQKWIAKVKVNGKTKHLGVFEDIEFADLVAQEARNKFHGAFARHS